MSRCFHGFSTVFLMLVLGETVHAQGRFLRPSFATPDFHTNQPQYHHWEYSHWDMFYTPHTFNGTLLQNRNYPDVAAPNGYAVEYVGAGDGDVVPDGSGGYTYVGPFNGSYVWGGQLRVNAQASGFDGFLPTNPNPVNPIAIFHSKNPTIRQSAASAFIIGPGFSGNIYSPFEIVSYILEDSVDYDVGSVVFQFQNQGRDVDLQSLKLRYTLPGTEEPVEIFPIDQIIEREAFASHAGFTFTSRVASEWDVSGLGIRDYEIVWKAAGTSCSIQEVILDTADAYIRDKGLPAKRFFTGATDSNWTTSSNWLDVDGGTSPPLPHANVVFQGGGLLNVGSSQRRISMLESDLDSDFMITGTGSLTLGTGFKAHDVTTPRSVIFDVPVHMTDFNFFDIGDNVTALLNKPFTGNTGFEKRGSGSLHLVGNNSFAGALFLSGGELKVSGINDYGNVGLESLDMTYLYLGKIELESSGTLGKNGVKISIGSTPFEIPGETRASHLVVKGERSLGRPIEFTGGLNPKILTFTETGTGATVSNPITFHNEVPAGIFGEENPTGDVSFDTPLSSDKVTFSGSMTGGSMLTGATPYALQKDGTGVMVFSGVPKTYKHKTHVREGTLVLETGANLTGGNSVLVDADAVIEADANIILQTVASELKVNGLLNGSGSVQFDGGPTVSGRGTIEKSLTIADGTVLSPGNSVGTIELVGDQIWGEGGMLRIEIGGASFPGVSDKAEIDGQLLISATSSEPFVIELQSLTQGGESGSIFDFNPAGSYVWTIASASGGISNFDASVLVCDASDFTGAASGEFSLERDGSDLLLKYTGNPAFPAYSQWAASLAEGQQGETDDADGDGWSNLVEFAMGTSGDFSDEFPEIKIRLEDLEGEQYPIIDFDISEPARPGLTMWLLSSSSLKPEDWQTVALKPGNESWRGEGIVTESEVNGSRKTISIREPNPVSSVDRRFYRLKITNDQ